MKKGKYLLAALVFAFPGLALAQGSSASLFEQYQVEIVLGLSVLVCLVAVLAMYVMLMAMKTILRARQAGEGLPEEGGLIKAAEGEENVGFWGRFWNRFNVSVPVAKEATVITDHEYDGIRELDNRLPPWWLYGFYFTIVFSVVYLVYYHAGGSGMSQDEEYQATMVKAEREVQTYLASLDNLIDENNVAFTDGATDLAAGKEIFLAQCAVCHAKDGGGGVGPNFTDSYWIHGGDIPSIFRTIKYGVPSKGMISWESQLSPKKMQQVASYIYTMEGAVSANPKAPQGELFEREPLTEAPLDSAQVEADIPNNSGVIQ